MARQVETMVWASQVPLARIGCQSNDDLTPLQVQEAAGLDWTVSKRPSYTLDAHDWGDDVGLNQAENTFHVVSRFLTTVFLVIYGRDYIPVQNKDMFEFFKRFIGSGTHEDGNRR